MTEERSEPAMDFHGFDRFSRWAGAFVLLIGGIVLLGWALEVPVMQSFRSGWVTMKANTAFALAMSGISLFLHGARDASVRGRPHPAHALGAVVAVIGAATISQYLFDIDLGIDQILFDEVNEAQPSSTPGRMAAISAVAFMLIGSALAIVGRETPKRHRLAQLFALAAGALALSALLGFIYGAISTVGPGQGVQIAIHTALALAVLAAGTLALEVRAGWFPILFSKYAGGQLARRLLPLAFIVPLGLGALQSIGEWAGLGELLAGSAIVAVITMLAFAGVIWRTARTIDETDVQWQASEQARLTLSAQADAAKQSVIGERAAREAAERAVREKDDALTLLTLVLESSPVGFALFDRNLRVQRLNQAFANITGARVHDHFVWMADDVIPEHSEQIARALQQVIETGLPVLNSVRVGKQRDSGRRQHLLSSKYPIRTREGGIIGVGMTLVDTTERFELESQLQQAQKMEAIGQLAGGVAHDFNNVLTAIKSFGELVNTSLDPGSPLREDIGEIIAAADRGTALTRQLLAFSRQQRLEPVVVDLNSIAEGVGKLLSRLIGTDVHCETILSPSLGRVLADPGQMEQVIVNLAVNARDAMPNGGTLRIETSNVTFTGEDAARITGHGAARAGDYVVLTVSDAGQGMDFATQNRIFDPFFTTKDPGKGTGLGLSTVYGIVAQSAGYITVASAPGQGTTFHIYFPRVYAEMAAATVSVVAEPAPENSETVLLVDDDDAVRTVLKRILARAGFNVLAAASAREAESIANGHAGSIQLLMTDLMMPEMNGDELAHRMREARPEIKVLFISGYTDGAVAERGLIRPDDLFLAKPFTLEGAVAKVREVLSISPRDQSETSAA
ncbi:MAG: ATP-binding protein [Gemmatimonadaceae bacterium]